MPKRVVYSLLPVLFFLAFKAQAQHPSAVPVLVPDINGRAVNLVNPAFPETAVAAGSDGATLVLKVVVNENGDVVSAQCSLDCPEMLKGAAELAALTSKFKPLLVDGLPVKYQGTLLYTFVVKQINWYRFGTALESTRQFDNISLGPVAQILSKEFATEKARLLALDANGGADYETRQKVIAETRESIRSRLKGMDLWRFELGMALRRVTFWPQAAERIDRVELQKAIDDLSTVASAAPDSASPSLIDKLKAISKYHVPQDISESELRRAINELARSVSSELR